MLHVSDMLQLRPRTVRLQTGQLQEAPREERRERLLSVREQEQAEYSRGLFNTRRCGTHLPGPSPFPQCL